MPTKKKKIKINKKAKKSIAKAKRKKSAKKALKKAVKLKKIKKSIKKKSSPAKPKAKKEPQNLVGVVTHYFPHVNAAVIKIKKTVRVNDIIELSGHTTNFQQQIQSMQIDHKVIQEAKAGDEIGLQVIERVREGDLVKKLS
jgi:hypothetical protein